MKKILWMFILGFMLLNATMGFATDYTQDANCQGAWLFEEGSGTTVADSSQNTNTGTFKADGEPAWDTNDVSFNVSGSASNSVDFDAVDDYINCGSDSSLDDLSAMTLMCWIYKEGNGENDYCYLFEKSNSDSSGFRFRVSDNLAISNSLQFRADVVTTDVRRYSNNDVISNNTWTHIAVTWDGSNTAANIHIYVNGTEVGGYQTSTNGSGSRVSDAGNDLILGQMTNGDRTTNGNITEAAVFDRVLNSTEIDDIYDYGLEGQSGGGTVIDRPHVFIFSSVRSGESQGGNGSTYLQTNLGNQIITNLGNTVITE